MLRRRALLLAAAMPVLRLRASVPGVAFLTSLPQERVAFRAAGTEGEIVLPAARARLAGSLSVGGRDLALLAFAADPPEGRLDLLALVGCDGGGLRIVALDVLTWQANSGAHLRTRLNAAPGGTQLVLQRDAAAPRSRTQWRRETWTDYLRDAGPLLADDPPRPPPPGTWQHALAGWRACVAEALRPGCRQITGAVQALCVPPDLSGATASPPCAAPADRCG